MIVDRDYIEQRALTLYEETHPVKLFRDESVDPGTRVQRVHIASNTPAPSMVAEDEPMPMQEMTYDEEEVQIHFIGAAYDKVLGTVAGRCPPLVRRAVRPQFHRRDPR